MHSGNNKINLMLGFSWIALILSPWSLAGLTLGLTTDYIPAWITGMSVLLLLTTIPQLIHAFRSATDQVSNKSDGTLANHLRAAQH